MGVEGKKLLVLGGTSASLDLVKQARLLGVRTIVTDEKDVSERPAKQIADEYAMVSTTDYDALTALIREKRIDGVFCGPSEFNIRNMISLCEKAGVRCYADSATWDKCANKDVFKQYCRKYGVDCTPEFSVSENSTDAELAALDYPIIVKPVDGSSSAGITTCREWTEVRDACIKARAVSGRKKIIVEKYIENSGEIFSASYLLKNGQAYPYLLRDTYIVDPVNRKTLISGFSFMPSHLQEYYLNTMDASVRRMLAGMGLRNGVAFFQALPYKGKIYLHEMGFRLSGGLIFKITEPLCHINDMQCMIRYALGEEICTDDDIRAIDINCSGKIGAKLMVPLEPGTIAEIRALEDCKALAPVQNFIQYYGVGDEVSPKVVGTLSQHFGRFTLLADDKEAIFSAVNTIQDRLRVIGADGQVLNDMPFDLGRVYANV
ncbi:MAG: ATP-grasp domain-containing protein [Clostridia bacterium]|nr:ATP-grasp domain-containing protein [Clostridia bacterium]